MPDFSSYQFAMLKTVTVSTRSLNPRTSKSKRKHTMSAVGFANAPVSKGVIILTTLASLGGTQTCVFIIIACAVMVLEGCTWLGVLRRCISFISACYVPACTGVAVAHQFLTNGLCVAASAAKAGTLGPLSLNALLGKKELWRVVTYQLAFSSAGELVIGILLLYTLRQFER